MIMDNDMKGWERHKKEDKWGKDIDEKVVEAKEGIVKVIEVPGQYGKKIVFRKGSDIVYGWYNGEYESQSCKWIKYTKIFEKYGGVVKAIKEACKQAGFEPKQIEFADWIAKKEFYEQG